MSEIISVKQFLNTETFENWQKEGNGKILSIHPLPIQIPVDIGKVDIQTVLIVLYIKNES